MSVPSKSMSTWSCPQYPISVLLPKMPNTPGSMQSMLEIMDTSSMEKNVGQSTTHSTASEEERAAEVRSVGAQDFRDQRQGQAKKFIKRKTVCANCGEDFKPGFETLSELNIIKVESDITDFDVSSVDSSPAPKAPTLIRVDEALRTMFSYNASKRRPAICCARCSQIVSDLYHKFLQLMKVSKPGSTLSSSVPRFGSWHRKHSHEAKSETQEGSGHTTSIKDNLFTNLKSDIESETKAGNKAMESLQNDSGIDTSCTGSKMSMQDGDNVLDNHILEGHDESRAKPNTETCGMEVKASNSATQYYVAGEAVLKEGVEKPYVCPQCGLRFKTSGHVRRHSMRHEEALLKCRKCPRKFKLTNHLEKHEKSHDVSLECQQCFKVLKHRRGLQEHMRRHSLDRVLCQHCGANYSSTKSLRSHVRAKHLHEVVSTLSATHTCQRCSKVFSRKSGLRRHSQESSCSRAWNSKNPSTSSVINQMAIVDEPMSSDYIFQPDEAPMYYTVPTFPTGLPNYLEILKPEDDTYDSTITDDIIQLLIAIAPEDGSGSDLGSIENFIVLNPEDL